MGKNGKEFQTVKQIRYLCDACSHALHTVYVQVIHVILKLLLKYTNSI